jgi:hypothetical protein
MPKDDGELLHIIGQMIKAGETQDTINSVIKEYESQSANSASTIHEQPQIHKQPDSYSGPDSFAGGVLNSLGSGDAALAGLKGLGGYIVGAVADCLHPFGSS